MSKSNIVIGTKFFKYRDDDTLDIIRIVRKKSENVFVAYREDKNKFNITEDELHTYTMLRPNAVYSFAIVINNEDKDEKLRDVITIMGRPNDKEPYVICRQMMNNIFYQMVTNETMLGSCLSQDTCPPDTDFKKATICHKLEKGITINGYLNDNPEDILDLAYKFLIQADKILSEQKKRLKNAYQGLCGSVKELLDNNGFWSDVCKGLKITELNDKIENCSLNGEQLIYLEKHISYLMDDVHILEYGYDIDFTKIKSDYMLLKDSESKLYLVNYLRGSFIQQEHLNDEELSKFRSIKI